MGTKKERVLIGVFDRVGDAHRAVDQLRDAKFADKKIGVLAHDKDGDPEVRSFKDLHGSKVGTGAAVGAAAGAGGGALWALGIAAGFLPAIGPVIAGGLLAALAASAGAGAAAGIVVGALTGLGVSEDEAKFYDEQFQAGKTVIVVEPEGRASEAYQILTSNQSRNPHLVDPATLSDTSAYV